MANKVRVYTTEELIDYNFIDTTPRAIRGSETVNILCRTCKEPGETTLKNIQSKRINLGCNWRCMACSAKDNSERGKLLIGDKNPFFGKQHTKEKKKQLKASSRKRWDATTDDDKKLATKMARKAAFDKYGTNNPAMIPEFQEKITAGQELFWSDSERISKWHEKAKITTFNRYGVEYASQSPIVKERVKNTCLDRYDSESYINSQKHQELRNHKSWYTSKGEIELKEFIIGLGLDADKRIKNGYELDVFIPSVGVAFEYNGLYYHSAAKVGISYHADKTQYAKHDGIILYHVFENEWQKRQQQTKNRIKSILNKNTIDIDLNQCSIVEVNNIEAVDFINKNHVHPIDPNRIKSAIGLKYNNEIVCLATFGKTLCKNNNILLNRFCIAADVRIKGALEKISQYMSQKLEIDLISWCDLKWNANTDFIKANWEPVEVREPDYIYYEGNKSKIITKKCLQEMIPSGVAEREYALSIGLSPIYDCGKIRFIYRYLKK